MHLTVPKLPCTLLPDLENIKRIMVETLNAKLKAKGKATTARLNAKSYSKRTASRGSSEQVPKKVCLKKRCSVSRLTTVLTRYTTQATAVAMTKMVSP
jgi:hypothetical protein